MRHETCGMLLLVSRRFSLKMQPQISQSQTNVKASFHQAYPKLEQAMGHSICRKIHKYNRTHTDSISAVTAPWNLRVHLVETWTGSALPSWFAVNVHMLFFRSSSGSSSSSVGATFGSDLGFNIYQKPIWCCMFIYVAPLPLTLQHQQQQQVLEKPNRATCKFIGKAKHTHTHTLKY